MGKSVQKLFNIGIFADYVDGYTTFSVADRTRKGETGRKIIDKGAKPYALDSAPDQDFDPFLFMPCV